MPSSPPPSPAPSPAHPLLRPGGCALLVALAATLPYLQTLGFGTVGYDDPWLVTGNHLLSSPTWAGLARIWLDLGTTTRLLLGAEYLPVRDMSVMLDFALFGDRLWGFHLTNLLLHAALCGAAVLALARWTGDARLALAAGLLFALHPLHVESVAWLSERKGLLAGLFGLLAAVSFHGFRRAPGAGRLLLTAALVALATLSKAVGVATVGMLAALLLLFPDAAARSRRAAWLALGGIALAALAALAPVYLVGARLVVETAHPTTGPLSTLWLALRILGLYLEHLLLMGELGVRYDIPAGAPWGLAAGGVAALLAAGSAALFLLGLTRRGAWRVPALGAALFWAYYLPASQLIFPLQNLAADRYMLLPSLGFCLVVSSLLLRLRPRLAGVLVTVLALAGGAITAAQAATWRDTRTLNIQALHARPDDLRALVQLSAAHREAGELSLADTYLRKAQAAHGEVSPVLLHRAMLRLRRGDEPGAVAALRRAALADPAADKVRANLALLLSRRGGKASSLEALQWIRQAVKVRPQVLHNQRTLGVVTLALGLHREAATAFRRALDMEPGNATNWYNLALALANLGQRGEALQLSRGALKIKPSMARAATLLKQLERE